MNKKFKKFLIGITSVLGINFIIYLSLVLSPSLLYANKTQIDFITIHHDQALESKTEQVVKDAISILKKSELYHKDITIHLCLNDGSFYPNLMGNLIGGTAFAFYDIAVVNHSEAKFNENLATFQWEINNNEIRNFDLTLLLAHEFTHNLQYNAFTSYVFKSTMGQINWKLEGHAEYVAREYKNDGLLKERIDFYLTEEKKEHIGIPVFKKSNGTIQNLSYFKYSLVVQYLLEIEKKTLENIFNDERSLEENFQNMLAWKKGS